MIRIISAFPVAPGRWYTIPLPLSAASSGQTHTLDDNQPKQNRQQPLSVPVRGCWRGGVGQLARPGFATCQQCDQRELTNSAGQRRQQSVCRPSLPTREPSAHQPGTNNPALTSRNTIHRQVIHGTRLAAVGRVVGLRPHGDGCSDSPFMITGGAHGRRRRQRARRPQLLGPPPSAQQVRLQRYQPPRECKPPLGDPLGRLLPRPHEPCTSRLSQSIAPQIIRIVEPVLNGCSRRPRQSP
jgi:hypothetical protein